MRTDIPLAEIVRGCFTSLAASYALQLAAERVGVYSRDITLQNNTTAIRVEFDEREQYVFVTLFQLRDGKTPPFRDLAARKEDPLNGFDLDDLIALRSWSDQEQPQISDGEGTVEYITRSLERYANALSAIGRDILTGNFAVFRSLAEIVVHRIADARAARFPDGPEYASFLAAYAAMLRDGIDEQ